MLVFSSLAPGRSSCGYPASSRLSNDYPVGESPWAYFSQLCSYLESVLGNRISHRAPLPPESRLKNWIGLAIVAGALAAPMVASLLKCVTTEVILDFIVF